MLIRAPDPNTHDMMTILDDEEFVASAVVYPSTTEEVQEIVRWANKYLIPIFPISMGRNRTDLSSMSRRDTTLRLLTPNSGLRRCRPSSPWLCHH